MKRALFTILLLIVAVASYAQGFGGGFGGGQGQRGFGGMTGGPITMLLMDKQVTQELALTTNQSDKLMAMGKDMGEGMRSIWQDAGGDQEKAQKAMRTMFEDLAKKQLAILTPDQNKRLHEIYVQDNGEGAIVDKGIQGDLGMKPEQTQKVSALQEGLGKAMMALGQKLRNQEIDFPAFQTSMSNNQKILKEELGKILTDDQRKRLETLKGKPFKRDAAAGGGGR